jgi:hypothetical protein
MAATKLIVAKNVRNLCKSKWVSAHFLEALDKFVGTALTRLCATSGPKLRPDHLDILLGEHLGRPEIITLRWTGTEWIASSSSSAALLAIQHAEPATTTGHASACDNGDASNRNLEPGRLQKESAEKLEVQWVKRELERLARESERLAIWIKSASATFQEGTDGAQTVMDEIEVPYTNNPNSGEKLAYRIEEAAGLLGLSRTSFWREVKRRKIFVTPEFKLVTRKELLRYLAEEEQLARRQTRTRTKKSKTAPLHDKLSP